MGLFDKSYGAGLRHGYIKDTNNNVYDIDAIVSVEASPEQDDTEVKGDDALKATFSFNRKETLTITANGLSLDVLQALTGNSVSSSATGAEIALGTTGEMSPPFVEVGAYTNGKNQAGTSVVIKKVWHRVQINKPVVKMAGETEFSVELEGISYQTATDISGASLGSTRTATLSVYEGSVS